MPIRIIGKSVLGNLGFSQVPSKMEDRFEQQLNKIEESLCLSHFSRLVMTSMTGSEEVKQTNGAYFPKIRKLYPGANLDMFNPRIIYQYCKNGEDKFRPGCDFIVWNPKDFYALTATTFSREAPILAFESSTGKKALGVILRPSLMKYGDYLFSSINEALGGNTTVTLVTCNHFAYSEGSIPLIVRNLASRYGMECLVSIDSEKDSECYHRGEKGNHVVALW